MRAVIGIFDQHLADIIARAAGKKAEVEVLAGYGKIFDRVVDEPGDQRQKSQQCKNLNCHRAIACIVDEHTQAERPRLFRQGGHATPPSTCCELHM